MSTEYYNYRGSYDPDNAFDQQAEWTEENRLQIRARIMEAVTRYHDEMWHMAHRRREEVLKGKQNY